MGELTPGRADLTASDFGLGDSPEQSNERTVLPTWVGRERVSIMRARFHTDTAVRLALADNQFEAVRLYVIRGRRLKVLSGEDLRSVFIHAIREWARTPMGLEPRLLAADAASEYMLRGQEPPYALVVTQTESILAALVEAFERGEREADDDAPALSPRELN